MYMNALLRSLYILKRLTTGGGKQTQDKTIKGNIENEFEKMENNFHSSSIHSGRTNF